MNNEEKLIVTLNVDQLKKLISETVGDTLAETIKPPAPFKVYPIKEAAEMLNVYIQTLRNYADKKLIESYRVGNRYYFTLDAIKKFIEKGGSNESTQQPRQRKSSKVSKTSD